MKHKLLSAILTASCAGLMPVAWAQTQSGGSLPDPGSYPQSPPPSYQTAPPELTLPAGTLIMVRTTELLSSDRNQAGDGFTSVLDQPLVAQGWVVARMGQTVVGQVATAQPAGRVRGVSRLAVELSELVLVDGSQVPIRTTLVQSSAGTSQVRDAEGVGTAAGVGAVIGAAAGGGTGAAIGAAAGAAAGIAGALSTRGRPTEIYPESQLTFRLEDPVTISTQQSAQAFRPVTQNDYSGGNALRNPPRAFRVETYPRPYYGQPYWLGAYPPYPYPGYFGYYGYYGFGSRVYAGPRIFVGRGFRRRH